MKTLLSRIFSGSEMSFRATALESALSSELSSSDIESYYVRIISDSLRRMHVPRNFVEITVKRAGDAPDGLPAFAGFIRVVRWDSAVTPVLLQNMPVIDARIRKVVNASVLLEHTRFAGLWFQASGSTQGAPKSLVGLPAELTRRAGGCKA